MFEEKERFKRERGVMRIYEKNGRKREERGYM